VIGLFASHGTNTYHPLPSEPDAVEAAQRRQEVITASREKYATPRAQVEALLFQAWEAEKPAEKPASKPAAVPANLQVSEPVPAEAQVPPPPRLPEVAPSEPKPSTVSERKIPSAPADLGRGGAQHKAIQHRIKEAAERFGFRSVIEKQILDGQGSVDLLLERNDETIACEISISTTIDHEVGNVAKCLKAGFPKVAIICLEQERLRKIGAAVAGGLGSEMAGRVMYAEPDQFIAHLQTLAPPIPKATKTRRGYRVKRSAPQLTPEEQEQREEAAIRSLAEAMQRKLH
jgi:hypothetical protein